MLSKVYNIKHLYLTIAIIFTLSTPTFAQLTITPTGSAASLAAKLAGPGITIVSDTLICHSLSNGTFVSVSTPITLDSGIVLCTGRVSNATGPYSASSPSGSTSATGAMYTHGDPDLVSLLGSTTIDTDACELIIHFIPKGDTVSFDYQFGSEEYRSSTCGPYNDAFAFFISGPGISTSLPGVNMALVPGTNIPVTVNSINVGTASGCGACSISLCNAMGSGSPFSSYYYNNTGGTAIPYKGYTVKLTARHSVTPCDTYRIKMSIVDAKNGLYDSGVFLAAGSLKTNSYRFDHVNAGRTILGVPNAIVKGCGPDSIKILSSKKVTAPTKFKFSYGGTATSSFDYSTLPDSVTMNVGDSTVGFQVDGLVTTATGTKTLVVYLSSPTVCGVIDTITLNILDAPFVNILTQDTTVCTGSTVHIIATGTLGLTYSWSPGTFLDNTTIQTPTSTPGSSITYTVSATLPGSLCAAKTDVIHITTQQPNFTILTADTTICQNSSFTLRVNGSDSFFYSWTPPTGLNSAGIKQPTLTGQSTNTYTVTANYPGTTCATQKSVTVTVIPTDFVITTIDTFLCTGATLVLNADVNPPSGTYSYSWTGPGGYTSAVQNPIITTATSANSGTYVLTVTNSGLCSATAYEKIDVLETPNTIIQAPPITICQYSPAMPLIVPGYNNLMWYPSENGGTPTVFAPYPSTDTVGVLKFYASEISFKSNCLGIRQEVDVTVKSCCNGTIFVPSGFTPNNDGKNDILRVVKTPEYALSEFTIFDRWGVIVFQSTTGDEKGWDGTYNGNPVDIGTYYYSVVANCTNSDKKPIILKGDVTLIR